MRPCIYDNYTPCEECGRCKTRQEIIAEGMDSGEIDEDTFACHYDDTEEEEG